MACVVVRSLMRTIELEFLNAQPRPIVQEKGLISCNEELIQKLHEKLKVLMALFNKNRIDGVKAIKDLETEFRDVAFIVEDEIEFQIVDLYAEKSEGNTDEEKTLHCQRLCQIFQQAIHKIDAIKEELEKLVIALQRRKTALDAFPKSDEVITMGDSSADKMVGKDEEFEIIKEMLIERGSKQQKVVSIIGMGGIGKTTLARRAYQDPSIASHFDKKAWVVASELHNKRQMLVGLCNSMGTRNTENSSDDELALQLYQGLKKQRYLVVIDNIWTGEAWDAVKACFPDDGDGSRVLLTTRLAEVANYTGSGNDFSHQMQLLNESESWNLFCERACRSRGVEFEIIGRPIVEKCKGLPLAIVVVAGLFSKLNTLNEQEDIANALNSFATTTIVATCSSILSLSYNHLPHDLKACFLYLGVFPEDHEINANNLARLWAAEGLVKAFENESSDAVAIRHIQELMDRNLILVSERSCCGRKIKAFRMHDLLLAFCAKEAQNENLLFVVSENGSDLPKKCFRWVSIQSSNFDVSTLYHSTRDCRSIFCFSENMRLNLKEFKLLRVLYFTESQLHSDIVDLIHLRYLPPALGNVNILKLFRAWNLQTLSESQMHSDIVDLIHWRYLPPALGNVNILKLFRAWNLQTLSIFGDDNYLEFPQLQYLSCYFICAHPPNFVHRNLRSIFWLELNHCTKEFLTNIPYVKKIKICGEIRDCNDCIESLAYLQPLENLYIHAIEWRCTSPHTVPINNQIVLLKNLKKLKFQSNCFEWKGISVLSRLPRLEVLKLHDACVGEEWELPENEKFCELIFLEISSTGLKDWKASGDHFPKLEHLSLFLCEELEKIPSGFADISTLKSIRLRGCLPSVMTSVEEIKEDQLDYLNNIVDVVVTEHPWFQERLKVISYDEHESHEHESDEHEFDE